MPAAKRSMLLCDGLLASSDSSPEAEQLLADAADAFRALDEPIAHALGACGATPSVWQEILGAGRRRRRDLPLIAGGTLFSEPSEAIPRLQRLDAFRIPTSQSGSGAAGLTKRERDVARLARQGYTAQAIGEQLNLSGRTVETHLERVKRRLGARRKSDLVRLLADETVHSST